MKRAYVKELAVYLAIGLAGAVMFAAANIIALSTTSHMLVASW